MVSIKQRLRKGRLKKINKTNPVRISCPQKRGVCRKVYQKSPKKPNSAQRWLASVRRVNGKKIMAYIPGEGGHGLTQHSTVLVRGGRVRDIPGVRFKLVRGVLDLAGVSIRKSSRSKYGTKKL